MAADIYSSAGTVPNATSATALSDSAETVLAPTVSAAKTATAATTVSTAATTALTAVVTAPSKKTQRNRKHQQNRRRRLAHDNEADDRAEDIQNRSDMIEAAKRILVDCESPSPKKRPRQDIIIKARQILCSDDDDEDKEEDHNSSSKETGTHVTPKLYSTTEVNVSAEAVEEHHVAAAETVPVPEEAEVVEEHHDQAEGANNNQADGAEDIHFDRADDIADDIANDIHNRDEYMHANNEATESLTTLSPNTTVSPNQSSTISSLTTASVQEDVASQQQQRQQSSSSTSSSTSLSSSTSSSSSLLSYAALGAARGSARGVGRDDCQDATIPTDEATSAPHVAADGAYNNQADGADDNQANNISWELTVGNKKGVKSNMNPPTSEKRSSRSVNPNYTDDLSLVPSKRRKMNRHTPSTELRPSSSRSTSSSTTVSLAARLCPSSSCSTLSSTRPPPSSSSTTEAQSTEAPTTEAQSTEAHSAEAHSAEAPTTLTRPNFQINTWNDYTGRTLDHVLADVHEVSHWTEPYPDIININNTDYITVSEHYEIVDPNDTSRSNLSDVERRVVCHGSRIETPAAKLQRQLDLLYGLNLTIMDRQTAHKQIVRDEISRVIEEMVALGVGGVHALRSNEETQAEAFSPDVIQADGETWDDANRIGRKFFEVTSSIPCDGTPDLIQATSALLTTTETRHLSRDGDEYIILHELFRSIKPGFCKLKNCILAVSNRNMWFIAYRNEETNTVGLYIPGSAKKAQTNGKTRTIKIPGRFTTTGKKIYDHGRT